MRTAAYDDKKLIIDILCASLVSVNCAPALFRSTSIWLYFCLIFSANNFRYFGSWKVLTTTSP